MTREDYVLQCKLRKKGSDWQDYICHSQIGKVMFQYDHYAKCEDPWWKKRQFRVIHRIVEETIVRQEND
jgi:hypothetical protein